MPNANADGEGSSNLDEYLVNGQLAKSMEMETANHTVEPRLLFEQLSEGRSCYVPGECGGAPSFGSRFGLFLTYSAKVSNSKTLGVASGVVDS